MWQLWSGAIFGTIVVNAWIPIEMLVRLWYLAQLWQTWHDRGHSCHSSGRGHFWHDCGQYIVFDGILIYSYSVFKIWPHLFLTTFDLLSRSTLTQWYTWQLPQNI